MSVTITSLLLLGIGTSVGKFLLKHYLGEFAQATGGGVIDFGTDQLKSKINNALAARKAERQFEQIGTDLVERIECDLQSAVLAADEPKPDPNKILLRLKQVLAGHLTADFVIRNQIDSQKLADALRAAIVPDAERFTPSEQILYDETISKTAQYIYRVSAKLPEFDERRAEESLNILHQLANEVSEILADARAIREAVVTRPLTDEIEYETSYRNAVVAELDKVELFGVDLPRELQEAKLTDAYITLRLRGDNESGQEDDNDDDGEIGDDESEPDGPSILSVEQALDRLLPASGRLLVRGGAGCGKTTLIRWTAIQAARGTTPDRRGWPEYESTPDGEIRILHDTEQEMVAADWRLRMPFVIVLRNCPNGKLPPPEELPGQIATEIGQPPPQWVQKLLKNGHSLVLVDGIDEVPTFNHRELFGSLKRLCDAYPNNYFVLTTRPDAVANVRFEDLGFVPAEIEPLADEERRLFVEHWFQAVAAKQQLSASQVLELQKEAKALNHLLGHTPWLAQLTTTPLYCAMTCALYRYRHGSLPQGLRAMCETLCAMMVDRRDRERKLPLERFPSVYTQLSYEQKKLILRRLAYYFVLAQKFAMPVEDAIEQVAKALAGMPQRSADEAKRLFEVLAVRSGLLRYATPPTADRPATVQFIHNTFKEFLAGEHLADEANPDFLVNQLADETWRRVGQFAVAAGTSKYQNDVLRTLLASIPDPLPRERRRKAMTDAQLANTHRGRAVFAFQCGMVANQCAQDVKQRLDRLIGELLPPKSLSEAQWLASAGNVVVEHLTANLNRYSVEAAACVRALRLIGTPEARHVLEGYKKDGRQAVLAELLKTFEAHQLPAVVHALVNHRYLASSARRNISDISGVPFDATSQLLDLSKMRITDLRPLAHLAQLKSLHLHSTRVADLSPLAQLVQLQSLNLGWTAIADLGPLANLAQLQSLYIGGTAIADLSPLANLHELQSLILCFTHVSGLWPLAQLTQLRSLDLRWVPATDLSPLAHLAQLRSLDLRGTAVTDLKPIAGLHQLQVLNIGRSSVADLSPLAQLAQLQSLDISDSRVMDLSPVAHLVGLKVVGNTV